MSKQQGFTVIEISIAIVVLITLTVFFVVQKQEFNTAANDQNRKSAINSMYYSLTEDFHKNKGYYPKTISRDNLKSVDPTLFTDPSGFTLNGNECTYTDSDNKQATDGSCEYHYQATNCNGDKCQAFKLTADLEAEGDYIKESPKADD